MKKILVWGTGAIAQELLDNTVNGEIIGFCQTRKTMDDFRGIQVYGIDEALPYYDYMIIANTYTDEIYKICVQFRLDLNKIIFLYPIRQKVGCTNPEIVEEVLGEKNWTTYCAESGIYENTFFSADRAQYSKMNYRPTFDIREDCLWPIVTDKYKAAGNMNNYFWQDLWAARLIHESGVEKHFDIGSRIDGFIAHLLAMGISVTLIDIRKFPGEVEKLHTIVDDATVLRQIEDESITSMSALCSLEHFGLGRYGDPIDPEACFQCFESMQRKIEGGVICICPSQLEKSELNLMPIGCFMRTLLFGSFRLCSL